MAGERDLRAAVYPTTVVKSRKKWYVKVKRIKKYNQTTVWKKRNILNGKDRITFSV